MLAVFSLPAGWYLSEKLNGVRSIWNGSAFISKNGNVFNVPDYLKAGMPAAYLDGELFCGDLGRMAGLCRKKTPNPTEWEGVTFQVFDIDRYSLDFSDRLTILKCLTLPAHVRLVKQTVCRGYAELKTEYDRIKAAGGEGIVIKSPLHMFRAGLSDQAFKAKYVDDFEIDGCTFDETGRFICARDYE